jgi:hypothetical protein
MSQRLSYYSVDGFPGADNEGPCDLSGAHRRAFLKTKAWRIENMSLTYRHELMKQTPLAPDYAGRNAPFHSGNGKGEGTIAGGLHKILALTFACFDRWVKPLVSQTETLNPSPIQEYDPYVEGLLRCLQSQRRD